jgi:uncharacterized membrane protein
MNMSSTEVLQRLIVLLSLAGLVLSGYLAWPELAAPDGVCPLNGPLGCSPVASSAYSTIGGVPVALLGAIWFLVAVLLAVRAISAENWLKFQFAWSILGAAGVVGLAYIELFLIGSVCWLCTLAHSIGTAILILSLAVWRGRVPKGLSG